MREKSQELHTGKIWMERALFGALVIALAAWALFDRVSSAPHTILVSGRPVVTVESKAVVKAVLDRLRTDGAHDLPVETRFAQPVAMKRATREVPVTQMPEAVKAVREAVSVEAKAFAILSNGKPAAAVASQRDAEEALKLVRERYRDKVDRLYAEPTFKERVDIEERYVSAELLQRTPEAAARVLTTSSEAPLVHVVQQGDRAVRLAAQYDLSLADMKKLNPGLNPDRLTVGDRLIVRPARAPITVVTKGLLTRVVDVPVPPDLRRHYGSNPGKREVRAVVTFENDEPVSTEVISQVTVWEKPKQSESSHRRYHRRSTRS